MMLFLFLAIAGLVISLLIVGLTTYIVILFCRGCGLVERKDWLED